MITGVDLHLFHLVNHWCGNWAVDRIVAYEQRNQLLNGGVMLAAYWWFWFAGPEPRRRVCRQRVIEALLGVLLALVLARTLAACLPFRMRPMYVAGIGYHAPSIPMDMNLENWSSFPSDMAALFFALSFGIYRLSRPLGSVLMVWTAGWICLPRLYLGIHYPSDLVFGAMVGVATVWAVARTLQLRDAVLGRWLMARVAAAEQRWPQAFYAAGFIVTFEITMIFNDVRDLVRAVLHAMRALGFVAAGEGGALFVTGGVLFLALLAVAMLLAFRRQRGARPQSGARHGNHPDAAKLSIAAAVDPKARRFHPSR